MIRKTLLNSFPESALAALKKANCSYRILHRSSLVEQDREVFSDLDGLLISSSSLEKNIELFAGCKFLHTFADTIRLMATRTAKELQVPLDNGCADPRAIFLL